MRLYYRIYQQILRMVSYFVKWRSPTIIEGENVYLDLVASLDKTKTVLIVTDEQIKQLGLIDDMIKIFDENHIKYCLFTQVNPNPTIENVEAALAVANANNCSSVIAFGGGSPMDCGKIVAARMGKPKLSVKKMRGLQKINKRTIPLYAIPTTSGTGSEATIAAVITDQDTHEKHAISDMCLIPDYAVFIPKLTCEMPSHITSTTGMDALTHAIEAYIGNANTKKTKEDAKKAIQLIYENLHVVYENGADLEARKAMQYASFCAGRSFTRAYVGNVHAVAHNLGGMYNIPHGLANAVALPIVLREYGSKVYHRLSKISEILNLCNANDSDKEKAEKLIAWIEKLNMQMNIQSGFEQIQTKDIPLMSKRACKEANPFYPVPEIWSEDRFTKVFKEMQGEK